MSEKAMSNLLYALIITKSIFTDSHGIGIYEYTKKQNSTNYVNFRIHIHPDQINDFELYSGITLKIPAKFVLNANDC